MVNQQMQGTFRINFMAKSMTRNWKKIWKNILVRCVTVFRIKISAMLLFITKTVDVFWRHSFHFSYHRYSHDVDWRIRFFDDISQTARIFFSWIHLHYCHPCYGMDNYNAWISSHGWYLHNTFDVLGVSQFC